MYASLLMKNIKSQEKINRGVNEVINAALNRSYKVEELRKCLNSLYQHHMDTFMDVTNHPGYFRDLRLNFFDKKYPGKNWEEECRFNSSIRALAIIENMFLLDGSFYVAYNEEPNRWIAEKMNRHYRKMMFRLMLRFEKELNLQKDWMKDLEPMVMEVSS